PETVTDVVGRFGLYGADAGYGHELGGVLARRSIKAVGQREVPVLERLSQPDRLHVEITYPVSPGIDVAAAREGDLSGRVHGHVGERGRDQSAVFDRQRLDVRHPDERRRDRVHVHVNVQGYGDTGSSTGRSDGDRVDLVSPGVVEPVGPVVVVVDAAV